MVSIELLDAGESEAESSFSLGSDGCAVDLVVLAEDLVSFEDHCVHLAPSEYRSRDNAVDPLHFEAVSDELDAEAEDGGQSGRDGSDQQLDEEEEHVQLLRMRPQLSQVDEIDHAR